MAKPNEHVGEQAVVKRMVRRHEEEEHGGAWKVAFADFCLALLCLFLVMWLLSVRQQENLQDLLKAAGGRMFEEGRGREHESVGGPRGSLIAHEPLRDNDGGTPRASRTSYESKAELAELAQMILRLAVAAGLSDNLRWTVTPYGLRVTLHDTDRQGMFEIGGTEPTAQFRSLLHVMGPLFGQIENQMLIVGHTDSRPYADRGSAGMSNWMLSSERAMAARRYMLEGGMPEHSVLQVVGLADGSPLNPSDTLAAENRRIELLILTKTQAHNISAMFGIPDQPTPLIDGVDTSLPTTGELAVIRGQISPRAQ